MSARLPGVSEPILRSSPSARGADGGDLEQPTRRQQGQSRPRRGPASSDAGEAALHGAVEEALHVEHHTQLPQRIGGDAAGDVAAEHHVDATVHGATHDVGRRALGVGRRREADRRMGPGHAFELEVADQVAVDDQKVRPEQTHCV
jgi:hypothetical protein